MIHAQLPFAFVSVAFLSSLLVAGCAAESVGAIDVPVQAGTIHTQAKVSIKEGQAQAAIATLRGLTQEASTLGLKYLTVECTITSAKGMSPRSSRPAQIIRFTQRRMISRAVESTFPG